MLDHLRKKMQQAAADLKFEDAAEYRDKMRRVQAKMLGLSAPG